MCKSVNPLRFARDIRARRPAFLPVANCKANPDLFKLFEQRRLFKNSTRLRKKVRKDQSRRSIDLSFISVEVVFELFRKEGLNLQKLRRVETSRERKPLISSPWWFHCSQLKTLFRLDSAPPAFERGEQQKLNYAELRRVVRRRNTARYEKHDLSLSLSLSLGNAKLYSRNAREE